jgi:hypothetical protein
MPTLPVDIANRALDECGLEAIGDLQDGSPTAQAVERLYWPTLRQLLAGAHWNFARKQIDLTVLADVSAQLVGFTDVPAPWAYMYEWPVDAVHARFVHASFLSSDLLELPIFSTPTQTIPVQYGLRPAPFIVASGNRPNNPASNWFDVEGHDPEQTRVILTNQPYAKFVFTGMMMYPDAWDPLFEQAMVTGLACRLAMPLIKDKKEARVIRSDNMQIAAQALNSARVRDGNEGWTVDDHTPDWIRARMGWGGSTATGMLFYPWASVPWLDGGIY